MDGWDDDCDDDFTLTQDDLSGLDKLELQALQSKQCVYNIKKSTECKPRPSTSHINKYCSSSSGPNTVSRTSSASGPVSLKPEKNDVFSKQPAPRLVSDSQRKESFYSRHSVKKSHPVQSNVNIPEESFIKPVVPAKVPGYTGKVTTAHSKEHSTDNHNNNNRINPSATDVNDVSKLRQEVETYKTQLKKINIEQYSKDGQIKMLRDSLHQKEMEISHHKQEQLLKREQEIQEKSEREHSLETEVDKLTSELHFKEREIMETQNNYKSLLHRMKPGNSPRTSTQVSPSGKDRRGSPGGFPSMRTFNETSPKCSNKIQQTDSSGTMLATTSSKSCTMIVPVKHSRGILRGSELIASMLLHGNNRDEGLLAVIQKDSHVTLDRKLEVKPVASSMVTVTDGPSTSVISPIRKRSADGRAVRPPTLNIVPKQNTIDHSHYEMASHGMNSLLCSTTHKLTCTVPSSQRTCQSKDHTRRSRSAGEICDLRQSTHDAIFILPIIEDNLTEYIDLIQEIVMTYLSTSPTNTSISIDSSNESSYFLKSKDISEFHFVKRRTLSALRCLKEIINHCPGARSVLIGCHTIDRQAAMETGESNRDDTLEKLDTAPYGICFHEWLQDSRLLHKLFQLVKPLEHQLEILQDTTHVEITLTILTSLAQNFHDIQLQSFQPVLADGTLYKCIQYDSCTAVISRTLELLTVLSQTNTLLSLFCTQSDSCIFLAVYGLSFPSKSDTHSTQTVVASKVIDFLCAICSGHAGGATLLVEADCSCSVEIVKSIVLILYRQYQTYLNHGEQEQFSVLRKGMFLLHSLSLYDQHFSEHHYEVEHQYMALMTGIVKTYNQLGIHNMEVTMVMDLCDFELEDEQDVVAMETE